MDGNLKDEELWQSFKLGNEIAFGKIYDQYFNSLYNYGIKISRDKQLVKDCIQELFIELWRYKANLALVNSIKYYLFKSLRRKLVREIQNKGIFSDISAEEYHFEMVLPYESLIVQKQISEEQSKELLKALNSLSKRQKEAIFLKFYENLSYQEVASIMSITVKSVYKVILSGIDSLRKNLKRIYVIAFMASLFN
jgi:RNA polymerase sigma factor (sigma-70 family)